MTQNNTSSTPSWDDLPKSKTVSLALSDHEQQVIKAEQLGFDHGFKGQKTPPFYDNIKTDLDAVEFLGAIYEQDKKLDTLDREKMTVETVKVCHRCGGSGHYSYNPITGTVCFACDAKPSRMEWTVTEGVKKYAQRIKARMNKAWAQSRKADAEQKARQDRFDAFLAKHSLQAALDRDWLERVFEDAEFESDVSKPHHILRDLASKLMKYGKLSEKQVALAHRLFDQIQNPQQYEEATVPAPEGRQAFTGKIVSVKLSRSQYGDHTRMTVKVETPDGIWLANGTLPAKIYDQAEAELGTVYTDEGCRDFSVRDISKHLRGREITLTATLVRGNDEHFAFAKRPAKVSLAPRTAEELEQITENNKGIFSSQWRWIGTHDRGDGEADMEAEPPVCPKGKKSGTYGFVSGYESVESCGGDLGRHGATSYQCGDCEEFFCDITGKTLTEEEAK